MNDVPQKKREEGAAMLVVMIILLSVTAMATLSIHTTSSEMRASGYSRQAHQAQTVADSGLIVTLGVMDQITPRGLLHSVTQSKNDPMIPKPDMSPFEPPLLAGKDGYRFYSPDVANIVQHAPIAEESLGPASGGRQTYVPFFTVDVNDHYQTTQNAPGQRTDRVLLPFLRATYTARGRMRLRGGDFTGTTGTDPREYHETLSTSRAYATSGPM